MLVGILLSRQLVSRLSLRKTEAGRRRKKHPKSTLIRTLAYNQPAQRYAGRQNHFRASFSLRQHGLVCLGPRIKGPNLHFSSNRKSRQVFGVNSFFSQNFGGKFSFRSHPLGSTSAKGCPIYCLTEHNRTEDLLKSKSMTFCYCGAGVGIGEGAVLYSNSD